MDGLRKGARESFDAHQIFRPPKDTYELLQISKAEDGEFGITENAVPEDKILDVIRSRSPSNATLTAQLRLLIIKRRPDEALLIDKDVFWDIFREFRLDPYLLYLISARVDGFHRIGPLERTDVASPVNFYINIRGSHLVCWSYSPADAITNALFICRPGTLRYESFLGELRLQKTLIDQPLLVGFVCGIDLMKQIDREINDEVFASLLNVESKTSHSSWSAHEQPHRRTNLAILSNIMSATAVVISLHLRYWELMRSIISALCEQPSEKWQDTLGKQRWAELLENFEVLHEATCVIHSSVTTGMAFTESLQQRTKTQLSVLFNLIAKEDANANIELAKDSKTLAISSKHDSSSMKTVAVMTMAFLPGTFFAALFALPLLQWTEPGVIRRNFWIYWAFTLPFTALIFLLWIAITKRQVIRRRLENRKQRIRVVRRATAISQQDHDSESEASDRNGGVMSVSKRKSFVDAFLRRRYSRPSVQAAVEEGDIELVQKLLNLGALVNSPAAARKGVTALQLAAIHCSIEEARLLLSVGAAINAPGAAIGGRRALEGAAEHSRIYMIQLMGSRGALIGPDSIESQ
ncbi:hypothetical protein BT63DRAFT_480505 [Microthyrium microscopicum]|uniref:Uncharacterized protein n=1 Tax=Microthyrium microscopicum TaxID=703497 RepID=A0A6A6U7Z8_9PEZI|nr:hypothetical protein BT63DRAFT_480505 [Microthyrium microscopicum]